MNAPALAAGQLDLWSEPWAAWAAGIVVGFPLATILLGEAADRLVGRPAEPVLRGVRNLALPAGVLWIFLTKLLGYESDSVPARLAVSAFAAAALFVGLGAANAAVFSAADRGTWRSRVPKLFLDLSRAFLVLLGAAVIASAVWEADLGGVLTALGVGSIVIGLALQDTLGNLMSGIAILFERPFTVGGWLRVGDDGPEGKVMEMNWRSVRLLTRENDLLVVPNLSLAGQTLRSYDRPQRRHMERLALGFSYSDSPGEVKAAMLRVAAAVPEVLADPPPSVFTTGYGDSSINYDLRVWLGGYENVPAVRDALLTGVWYEARRSGLTIPFPIRTTLLYDGNAVDAADRPAATVADLRIAEAFRTTDADDLAPLAAAATRRRFAAGETILPPGGAGRTLMVVLSGSVELWAPRVPRRGGASGAGRNEKHEARRVAVAELSRGDLLGSVGLLPAGEATTAADALTECELLCVPAEAVRSLLDRDRSLARELASLVEARRDAVRRAARGAVAGNGRA